MRSWFKILLFPTHFLRIGVSFAESCSCMKSSRKNARRDGDFSSNDSSGPSSGSPSSSSGSGSRDVVRDLPGYVYDPERNRYFRTREGEPQNNFTISVDRIFSKNRKKAKIWVHPQLQTGCSLAKILMMSQSGQTRRNLCIAENPVVLRKSLAFFQNRFLEILNCQIFNVKTKTLSDRVIPVDPSDPDIVPAFNIHLDGNISSSFDAVTASFESVEPQVVFASGEIRDQNVAVELRLANLKWLNDCLIPVRTRKLTFPYRDLKLPTTGERIEVGSVHILRDGMTFMSCARYDSSSPEPKGFFILDSAVHGMRSTCLSHFQNVCATNYEHGTVASSCGSPPCVLFFDLEDASRIRQMNLPDSQNVVTSLEFHPKNKGILFVGNSRGQVFRRDWRQQNPEILIDRKSPWESIGLHGNCRVTTIKALENPNWFLTGVAALPDDAAKISLWDCRNLRTPFTNFEKSQMKFHREKLQIDFSSDQNLVVVSDSAGFTRFWDLNSGTLLASIPLSELPCFSSETDVQEISPISFFHSENNKKVLLVAKRGKDPRIVVQNLRRK